MICHLSLTEMARRLAAREISAVEAVEAHLRQIESKAAAINPFVVLLADRAMEQARAAGNAAPKGPLHGVPVTIKDSLDLAGFPTLCGSKLRLDHRAAADSTVAARLASAGAIILGKTNCPEFLTSYETDNFTAGRTNNPWNVERTPGGSSGGEAAAIAAYCSAGGVGSDGGGSIRLPAHFCGIAGLKPTPGRVSAAGHYPAIQHPGGLLGVVGPMARSVADVAALYRVLEGPDIRDPFSVPIPRELGLRPVTRAGVMEQFRDVPVQPAIRDAVRQAARLVESLGIAVEEFQPRGLDRAPNVWSFFFTELAAPFTRELLAGREDQAHWTGTEFYDKVKSNPEPTGRQVVENLAARDAMRRGVLEQMSEIAILIAPACGVTAFRHRERRYPTGQRDIGLFQAMMPLTWVNLLGFPSLAIPMSFDESGLPVGVQIIGRPWEEERVLELGVRLEQARGPLSGPPGY